MRDIIDWRLNFTQKGKVKDPFFTAECIFKHFFYLENLNYFKNSIIAINLEKKENRAENLGERCWKSKIVNHKTTFVVENLLPFNLL